MAYLIGTDEAGYAPNLGPLVISATLWQVPESHLSCDLYRLLRRHVCRRPSPRGRRLALGDSKVLYRPGDGLALLERGLLAALGVAQRCPANWHELWTMLDGDAASRLDAQPWHVGYRIDLPLENPAAELDKLVRKLRAALDAAGIRLVKICSTAVFPERFNELTDSYNKADALSRLTLELVARILAELNDDPVLVLCDKHGGRNRYGPLLQQQFPDSLVEVHRESRAESIYRWGRPEQRVEVRFCMNCERHLPAALASMASKYLREISMRAFNHFWCGHLPSLRPTAGYPRDSKRFKAEISAMQTALGIGDRILWRAR